MGHLGVPKRSHRGSHCHQSPHQGPGYLQDVHIQLVAVPGHQLEVFYHQAGALGQHMIVLFHQLPLLGRHRHTAAKYLSAALGVAYALLPGPITAQLEIPVTFQHRP